MIDKGHTGMPRRGLRGVDRAEAGWASVAEDGRHLLGNETAVQGECGGAVTPGTGGGGVAGGPGVGRTPGVWCGGRREGDAEASVGRE